MTAQSIDSPAVDEKHCQDCGALISRHDGLCSRCGVRQVTTSNKSRLTAAILAIVLGGFGAHKFYLERPRQGILYLIFVWTLIPILIGLIEGLIYLSISEDAFQKNYVFSEVRVAPVSARPTKRLSLGALTLRVALALGAIGLVAFAIGRPSTPKKPVPSTELHVQSASSIAPSPQPRLAVSPSSPSPTPIPSIPVLTASLEYERVALSAKADGDPDSHGDGRSAVSR